MVIIQNFPLEICRKFIITTRNEETFSVWRNTHLAVRTPKGIHFYEFSHNLENIDKRLDCVETFIGIPTSSPSEKIFDCDLVRRGLKNRDISEMMLNTAMWGHSDHLVNEMTAIVAFQLSPYGLVRDKASVLAVLNNIGNVEMYIMGRSEWFSVLDLSSCVRDQYETLLKEQSGTFDELKKKAYSLATSAICWSPITMHETSYFVTCQNNGVLMFWLIQCPDEDISAKYCGKIQLVYDEIIYIKWIPRTENKFMLLCSNVSGIVMLIECQINKEQVIMLKSHMLWEHKDKMVAKCSEYYTEGNKILFLYNKHRHIVAQLIDENGRVISQSIDNINDHKITSITKNNGYYYVSTVNFKLYMISMSIGNNFLKVSFDSIELKDIGPTMELYSTQFSMNGVICALIALDRRIMHKKYALKMETIFIQAMSDEKVIEMLLNNPKKQLTTYWDCIELIRFKIVKLKTLPKIDFKHLLCEGDSDIYKLRLYLIFLIMYTNLVKNIKITTGLLPETSIELIKDKILMLHACSNLNKLYNASISGKSLNNLDQECFVGSKKYLQFYGKKYESILTNLIKPEVLSVNVNDFQYCCQCCDEEIEIFSCKNGHHNMFCSLTFTPINSLEYIVCKYCNVIARVETYSEKPLCPFCDSYLEMNKFCE